MLKILSENIIQFARRDICNIVPEQFEFIYIGLRVCLGLWKGMTSNKMEWRGKEWNGEIYDLLFADLTKEGKEGGARLI